MFRFLIDESTGIKVKNALIKNGHDVIFVADFMKGAKNGEVLNTALSEGRILITNDKDFGELIYHQKRFHSGVILLRLKIDTPDTRIAAIRKTIEGFGEKLKGNFVVVSEDKIRIRKP